MGIVFIVLAGILVFVSVSYVKLRKEHHLQLERIQRQENTIKLLQQDDIKELIYHVRQVMAGEVVYEWDCETGNPSPLTRYSFTSSRRQSFPDTHTIEFGLNVWEINLEDSRGEMIITYFIRYVDSTGRLLSGHSVARITPTRWILERQEEKWVIVKILDYKVWLSIQDE